MRNVFTRSCAALVPWGFRYRRPGLTLELVKRVKNFRGGMDRLTTSETPPSETPDADAPAATPPGTLRTARDRYVAEGEAPFPIDGGFSRLCLGPPAPGTVASSPGGALASRVGRAVVFDSRVCVLRAIARGDGQLTLYHPTRGQVVASARHVSVPRELEPWGRLDTTANIQARQRVRQELQREPARFPRVRDESWELVEAQNPRYNCVAHTLNVSDRRIRPGDRLADFDALYAEHGFVPLACLDFSFEAGVQKVFLCGLKPGHLKYDESLERAKSTVPPNEQGVLPCHVALQRLDGLVASKIGKFERVALMHPQDLEGGEYGEVIKVYARSTGFLPAPQTEGTSLA